MKAHRPGTDQEAEFEVFANGIKCSEYILPSATADKPNLVECFIEVKPEDELAIHGKFAGSVLHAALDFVVDGTFAGDSRFEPDSTRIKYVRTPTRKFGRAMHCPKPHGWTSKEPPNKMREGHLRVKELGPSAQAELKRHETEDKTETRTGVGSVVLAVNVNQDQLSNYDVPERQICFGEWRERSETKVRKSAIPPDSQIDLDLIGGEVNTKRSLKHRQHWKQTRYGDKAWAKFIFYYRTKKSLDAAGCIPRPQGVQELDPWDHIVDGPFVFADKDERAKAKRAKKADLAVGRREDSPRDEDSASVDDDRGGNPMFVSPAPSARDEGKNAKAPRPAKKKKGRLGGTLKLQKDGEGTFTNIPDGDVPDTWIVQSAQDAYEQVPPLQAEQTSAKAIESRADELPDAIDDLFEDDDSVFAPSSNNGDRVNIVAGDEDVFSADANASSTAGQNHTSTNAEMGSGVSYFLEDRPNGEYPTAAPATHDDVEQESHARACSPLAADAAEVIEPLESSASGPPNEHANTQGAALTSSTPHAGAGNQSPYYVRTKSGYASTSPTSSPTLQTSIPVLRGRPTPDTRDYDQVSSSEAAVNEETAEMKQTRNITTPEQSHASAGARHPSWRDAATPSPTVQQPYSDLDRIPSVATIRAAISEEGIAAIQLAKLLSDRGPFKNTIKAKQAFNARVTEVATQDKTHFFLKTVAEPITQEEPVVMSSAHSQAAKQDSVDEGPERQSAQATKHYHTARPALQPAAHTQLLAGSTVTSMPTDQIFNPAHKRSASAMSPALGSNDPPAKRDCVESPAERRARLEQEVQVKRARNAAKRKEIEDRRNAAEAAKREKREAAMRAKEEQELKEIEELERRVAEADDEYGEMEMEETKQMAAEADEEFGEMEATNVDAEYESGGNED